MRIDFHVHVWKEGQYTDKLEQMFTRINKPFPRDISPDMLLREMDQVGIDKAVVLAFRSRAIGLYTTNEYVAEFQRAHPDRFIGFGVIDLLGGVRALEELDYVLGDLGLKGLGEIATGYEPVHANDRYAYRVYEKIVEYGVPIMFHLGTPVGGKIKYVNPEIFDEVAVDWPEMKIILAHCGGLYMPQVSMILRKNPNVSVDISSFIGTFPGRTYRYDTIELLKLIRFTNPAQVLYASDWPFQPMSEHAENFANMHLPQQVAELLGVENITEDEREQIFSGNGLRLLGIARG